MERGKALIDIDNSSIEPSSECSMKMWLKDRGYAGKDGESDAMDSGSCFHDGLEVLYKGGTKDEALAKFDESYWGYFPPDSRVPTEDRFSHGNLRDHFEQYIDRQHRVRLQTFDVLETEQIIGMPLDSKGEIIFWMKRDLKVRDGQTSFIMPVDHKTTHRITKNWTDARRLSSQIIGYTWGTEKESGEMCNGAYINAIETTLLPTSSSRCKFHKVSFKECRLEHTKAVLLPYEVTPEMKDAWRRTFIYLARKVLHLRKMYPTPEFLPAIPCEGFFNGGCFKFFKHCEFANFCRMGTPAHMIDSYLVKREWTPWNDPNAKFIDWRK